MKFVEAHSVKTKVMRYARYERDHIAVVTEGLNHADVLSITRSRLAVEFEVKVSRSDLQKELAAIRYATITMKEGRNLAPAYEGSEQMALNIELGKLKQKSGGWSKISKHEEYIDPKGYFEQHRRYMLGQHYLPNYFYLVVPEKLVPLAIEGTKGTGYGVIAYDGCRQKDNHPGYFYEDKWLGQEHDNKPEDAVWRYSGMPCEFADWGCYKEIAVRQKARKIHSEHVSDGVIMSILHRAVTENISLMDEVKILNERLETAELVAQPE